MKNAPIYFRLKFTSRYELRSASMHGEIGGKLALNVSHRIDASVKKFMTLFCVRVQYEQVRIFST